MTLSREALGLLLGIIGVIIFGGTLPATRLAVQGLDPWFVTFGRAAAAGVLAVAVLAVLRRPWPGIEQQKKLLLAAVMLIGGFPGFMALAMVTLPAAHGGIVLSILPIATAIAGALILGERPSLMFWLTAIAGAALVLAFAFRSSGGSLAAGDLYLLAAAACAATGYSISAGAARGMPGWEVICWQLALTLPVTVPLSLWLFPATPAAVPAAAWAGFAYTALFSMFLGFFAWNTGLAMGGVARVSQVQLLQTFVTVGLAALVNGERVDSVTWVFAAAAAGIIFLSELTAVKRQS